MRIKMNIRNFFNCTPYAALTPFHLRLLSDPKYERHYTKRFASCIFAQFSIRNSDGMDLPFPTLKSRLASTIVLSFQGTSKEVIQLTLILSRKSRNFIISQGGLKGFLVKRRTSPSLLLKEFRHSVHLRSKYTCYFSLEEFERIYAELSVSLTDLELDLAMRQRFPELYFKCMKAMGRDSELFDGTITP